MKVLFFLLAFALSSKSVFLGNKTLLTFPNSPRNGKHGKHANRHPFRANTNASVCRRAKQICICFVSFSNICLTGSHFCWPSQAIANLV